MTESPSNSGAAAAADTDSTTRSGPGLRLRFQRWLPESIDQRARLFAWLSLISQTLIVGTGGAVRLTGSGLGCPSWPLCTEDSLVNTPEMGIHGIIEFGNRTLTVLVGVIALITVILLWKLQRQRRDLWLLAILLLCGIPMQAVLGGLTVLSQLNPWVVGLHFLPSPVLVALATVLLIRVYRGPGPYQRHSPLWLMIVTHLTSLLVAVTVVVGVLTTGSGPHAGDHGTARNGLDPAIMQHVHSWPAYLSLGLTLLIVIGALLIRRRLLLRFSLALLATELVQMAIGIAQSRLGLPELLVGLHLVLACVLVAFTAGTVLALKDPESST